MSTLQTYNLKHPDASGNQVTFTSGGDTSVTGSTTFTSPIKASKIENASTTDGGVEIDSDGHVQVDGLQLPTAGSLSNRNLVDNGAMNIKQRSEASRTTDGFLIDRFITGVNGGVQTTTRETLSSSDTPHSEGFRNYLRCTNTTAVTDTAANYRFIMHSIEADVMDTCGWNYTSSSSFITMSFWVRASVSQEYYGYINNNTAGTIYAYPFSLGTLAANTWTRVVVTVPGNSGLVFDQGTGSGFQFILAPFWGTNFTDSSATAGAWKVYAGGSRTPDYATTWATTAGATFDLTGLQIEVGEKRTPFEHRTTREELQRCYRYYYRVTPGNGAYWGMGVQYNATSSIHYIQFPVPMRIPITAMETTGTASDYKVIYGTGTASCSAAPIYGGDASRFGQSFNFLVSSGAAGAVGDSCIARSGADAAFLAWSAEI